MAYPYANQYGYPYYQPPMQDQLAQLRQGQFQPTQVSQPQSNSIIWVQGEAAARSYMVAPGNTVMLMDSDASTFYLKSADNSGVPQPLRVFDYTERTAAPKTAPVASQPSGVEYVTADKFRALEERLTALENKPCKCSDKKKVKEDEDDA